MVICEEITLQTSTAIKTKGPGQKDTQGKIIILELTVKDYQNPVHTPITEQ
jgi:hypothetical protein